MGRNTQTPAQQRNWAKFMVCGIKGELSHLLNTKEDVVSDVEYEDLKKMQERIDELVDNWDKGTEKLNLGKGAL